ncbi:MAG: DUF1016 N-terminal domain-containing protein [Candidatus Omnitrophica bacterium]|nr:DUF1016 N-terminal domain-containing protein [Candidatus Omnitrophota bacterium]
MIKHETVLRYWRVGKYIFEHALENKGRAGYGEHLIERLSLDLRIGKRSLERSVQFCRAYPKASTLTQLSWSHFVSLLAIEDEKARKQFEQKALENNWNVRQLKKQIARLKAKQAPKPPKATEASVLSYVRGALNCRRIITIKDSQLAIDCGFQLRREFPEGKKLCLKEGDIVEIQNANIKDQKIEIKKAPVGEDEIFTYTAEVEKIIDGDTLWALIGCGFGFFIRQKLRLRGIDCPELSSAAGQRAKHFVQGRLRGCNFIIVKTRKNTVDKYDRYLTDIFYSSSGKSSPEEISASGNFLNQELLDKGLAKVFL